MASRTSCLGLLLLVWNGSGQVRAEAGGVTVDVPAGWQRIHGTGAAQGPISLATSVHAYSSGGVLLEGNAEIDITSIPAPRNLQATIRGELTGAKIESFTEAAVGSNPGVTVLFSDTYGKLVLASEAIYVLRGSRVFKFYLSYHAGDPRASEYRSVFELLVSHASYPG